MPTPAEPPSRTRCRLLDVALFATPLLLLTACDSKTDAPGGAPTAVDPAPLDADHRRAAGLLARYEYADAVEALERVVNGDDGRVEAQVDLAIAVMNRQLEDDEQNALDMIEAIATAHPDDLRAAYVAGVLLQRAGEDERAAARFRTVVEGDPTDAYGWYHLGLVLEREQPAEAMAAYRRAAELDPYLRSAWFRIGSVAARLGDDDAADAALATFERLETNPRAVSVKPIYGRLGTKAMAAPHALSTVRASRPEGPVWTAPAPLSVTDAPAWRPGGSISVADLDDDGRLDVFIAGGAADGNAVLLATDDGHRHNASHPLASISDVRLASFADIDHDGRVDAFLGRRGPDQLWLRTEDGGWRDATETAGLAGGDHDTVDAVVVDADHDGDLDILAIVADGPDRLWNNDRTGAFTDIAPDSGIGGDAGSRRAIAVDLDGTRDLDLLVIRDAPPHLVHLNDRLWSYTHDDARFATLAAADLRLAAAGDLDGDGVIDLVTADSSGGVDRWTADDDGVFAPTRLRTLDAAPTNLLVTDSDGDGTLDVVTDADLGLDKTIAWSPILREPGRGFAVIATTSDDGPSLVDAGPGRFDFTAIELAGTEDATQSLRTNADGIGAIIAARCDDRWTVQTNLRPHAGPGQSRQPIPFGLGGADALSFLLVDWPDGLFQGEVPGMGDGQGDDARPAPTLAAGVVDRIPEIQRQVSSCPVLFAHDGTDFRFVSDVLGVGGIGYLLEPGVYSEPRPFEAFPMPTGSLAPDADGRLRLVLCEPMEEACYLDAARLVGWSLPDGWSLAADERLAIEGPAATGAPIFFRQSIAPIAAINERAEPVLASIASADGVAAPLPDLDRRFIGRLGTEHAVTIEFAEPIPTPTDDTTPWLLMDGWVEYPYAQTMFAAWQAGATYDAPSLDARDRDGVWHEVQPTFGYPAGMPRTAAFPLASLPEGCDALRLRTNQEVYWDRLRVVIGEPAPATARRVELDPVAAEFSAIGFPKRIDHAQRRPDYDWASRTPLWDVRHQRGRYTGFGDVRDLVSAVDGVVVTIGPGEGVELAYQLPAASVADVATMHWILECHGWCKDRDLFTRTGETLEPIPGDDRRDAGTTAMLEATRTRIEAGR
jgi:Tfp pilus assembly protein PilF